MRCMRCKNNYIEFCIFSQPLQALKKNFFPYNLFPF